MNSISIVIPVYNVAEHLVRCVDSVLAQDCVNLEVLLINDGSTDNSGELCDYFSKKDLRVKVFHQLNSGVSAARNKGMKEASGDWICFVDADDWIEPDSLSKLLMWESINRPDLIIGRAYVNHNGTPKVERYPFTKEDIKGRFSGLQLVTERQYLRGSVWGVLYSRDFLIKNKIEFPLNLRNGEDSIFFAICMVFAKTILFKEVLFYNIYERIGSASRSWSFERILGMVDNLQYINNYMINRASELTDDGRSILNYSKYGVISNMWNKFSQVFSFRRYFILRKRIREVHTGEISIGNIKINRAKVRILNFSLDFFAFMILIKNKVFS